MNTNDGGSMFCWIVGFSHELSGFTKYCYVVLKRYMALLKSSCWRGKVFARLSEGNHYAFIAKTVASRNIPLV